MTATYWLIFLAILIFIEILTMGLTTIWFAGGALVAFILASLNVPVPVQVVAFLVVSVVLIIFTRPLASKYLNKKRVKTNYEGIIGKIVKVTERIDNFNATGAAMVNGQEWTARADIDGKIIEPGTAVKVVNISGVKLIVTEYKEEYEQN